MRALWSLDRREQKEEKQSVVVKGGGRPGMSREEFGDTRILAGGEGARRKAEDAGGAERELSLNRAAEEGRWDGLR